MLTGVSKDKDRKRETGAGVDNTEVNRDRSKPVEAREITGEKCGRADGEVAGEFIEPDCQAATPKR